MSEEESELEKTDEYCLHIIMTLLAHKKLRFNELYNALRHHNLKLSRPTLVSHLKHLAKKRWILRRQEDVQWVTYELTEEKAKSLEQAIPEVREQLTRLNELSESEGTRIVPLNLSLEETADLKLRSVISMYLEELKREITLRSVMKISGKTVGKDVDFLLFSRPFHRRMAKGLINHCLEEEEFRKRVSQKIDELHKKIKKGIIHG